MDPVIAHDPVAKGLAIASLSILVAGELRLTWTTRATRNATTDRNTQWFWGLCFAATIVTLIHHRDWAPGLSISGGAWWPFVVGFSLFWAGLALRWWGVRTLGRFFQLTVVVLDGHRVVQDGPYRRIRHPGYAGVLALMLGTGLAFDNWLALGACVVLPLVGMLPRMLVEERYLEQQLGDDYRAYEARTPRLIPGVW